MPQVNTNMRVVGQGYHAGYHNGRNLKGLFGTLIEIAFIPENKGATVVGVGIALIIKVMNAMMCRGNKYLF